MIEILTEIIEPLDQFTIIVATISAVFSAYTSVKTRFLRSEIDRLSRIKMEPITIRVRSGSESITLPYRIRRDQLSRQELMGILGLYAGGNRFQSHVLRPLLESGELSRVIAGETQNGQQRNIIEVQMDREDLKSIEDNMKRSAHADQIPEPTAAP